MTSDQIRAIIRLFLIGLTAMAVSFGWHATSDETTKRVKESPPIFWPWGAL